MHANEMTASAAGTAIRAGELSPEALVASCKDPDVRPQAQLAPITGWGLGAGEEN